MPLFNHLQSLMQSASGSAATIISVSLMLFAGFAMTRITRLAKLPNVTAYIVAGILIGPYCLNAIPGEIVSGMDFLSDIALAFIAFSTGEFFRVSVLKKNGLKVIVITVLEACMASVLVYLLMKCVLGLDGAISIVLAALAAATAPASTMMTIRQTGAHGDFVNTLVQVVALDDVVGLLEYSVAISVAMVLVGGGAFQASNVLRPIVTNLGVLGIGSLFGLLMKWMMKHRSTDNRLIISIACLFTFCGACALLDVSPLLGCMSMGMVYINLTGDDLLFAQLASFSPPILLLFFVRSGLCFDLGALFSASPDGSGSLLTIGILYFFARIIGKYAGAWLGCRTAGLSQPVCRCLGLALIPQAGVSIGLAALCARTLGDGIGSDLYTIIMASSVLYELIGPGCAKLALYLSHSYTPAPKPEHRTAAVPKLAPNS